ncbi:MAG: hypothetical protein CMQ29_07470 [Gammaproteobacteria bacterium]|nr:hypothetical protein [Gammaproteobacteria bacterium]
MQRCFREKCSPSVRRRSQSLREPPRRVRHETTADCNNEGDAGCGNADRFDEDWSQITRNLNSSSDVDEGYRQFQLTRFARTGDRDADIVNSLRDHAFLRRLANATVDHYWITATADRIASASRYRDGGAHRKEMIPIWNAPLLFVALVLYALAEWLVRTWGGRI